MFEDLELAEKSRGQVRNEVSQRISVSADKGVKPKVRLTFSSPSPWIDPPNRTPKTPKSKIGSPLVIWPRLAGGLAIGRRVYSPVYAATYLTQSIAYDRTLLQLRAQLPSPPQLQGSGFRTLYSPLIRDADGFIVWETAHRVAGRVLRR